MSISLVRCCLMVTISLIFLRLPAAWAQDSPAAPVASNPADTASDSGELKLPIESEKPYSTWKHHVAEKPEEAIVLVRYGGPGAGTKTAATGLVVRCDGFVLVPRAARDAVKSGGTAEVVIRRADGEKLDEPLPVAARFNPYTHVSVPYALIKTNDHHIRSLPMLASANVKSGNPVSILWATPENGGVKATISSLKASIGSAGSTKETFLFAGVAETNAIPAGAIVVDDASGAAVGTVTQTGSQPVFTTFARFNIISGEVGLAPDRNAVRLGDRPGTLPRGTAEMVWIPGGPAPLDGSGVADFVRSYKTTVACTPGFWMAVQPVTNGEYRRWLSREVTIRGLPLGWLPGELQLPTKRREDRPACGMIVEDAQAFAAAHQSRLPTEIEWRRAAYVRDTGWADEMTLSWNKAGELLGVLYEQQRVHVQQLIARAQEAARQRIAEGRNSPKTNPSANIVLEATPELVEDTMSIHRFTSEFLKGQWMWGQVAPNDWFTQDKSIFGVKNVLINAPELVLARKQEEIYAPKRYPALVDPDLTEFGWAELGSGGASGSFVASGRPGAADPKPNYGTFLYAWTGGGEKSSAVDVVRQMVMDSLLIRYWRGGTVSWKGTIGLVGGLMGSDVNSVYSSVTSIQAQLQTHIYAGFRCAR